MRTLPAVHCWPMADGPDSSPTGVHPPSSARIGTRQHGVVFSTLTVMFAASIVGITSRLALRLTAAPGNTCSRTSFESAASPCSSPSHSKGGLNERNSPANVRALVS